MAINLKWQWVFLKNFACDREGWSFEAAFACLSIVFGVLLILCRSSSPQDRRKKEGSGLRISSPLFFLLSSRQTKEKSFLFFFIIFWKRSCICNLTSATFFLLSFILDTAANCIEMSAFLHWKCSHNPTRQNVVHSCKMLRKHTKANVSQFCQ